MTLTPYISVWVVMAVGVLALALYRMTVAHHEDDTLHIGEKEAHLVVEQTRVFKRIEAIDWWGKLLTVIAVIYGLVLAGVYLYHVWLESAKVHWQ